MNDSIELVVDESTIQSLPVSANFDEVKAWLIDKLAIYKNIVVTEDSIAEGKAIKSNINRLSKAISDRRIAVKKRYMQPLDEFEFKAKELCFICNEVSSNIDKQIRVFDEQKKQDKRNALKAYFDEHIGEYASTLAFESIENPRWMNVTYSVDQAQADIDEAIKRFDTGVTVIRSMGSEFEVALLEKFVSTRDLSQALALKESLARQKMEEERRKAAQTPTVPPPLPKGDDPFEAQQKPAQPVYTTDEVTPMDDVITLRFEVTATRKQFKALSDAMKQLGITPKRI